ncbi:MAG TPA: OmpH family outer membrane protein [Bryobacteraceae bacterium]|nr:OmpH family outer membrane protein [Bryobacteraceae bacterium]
MSMGICLLAAALASNAQSPTQSPAPTKVGIINIQQAILSTKDGQKAADELQQRYEPKRKELEQKQNEINALRDQLSKGSNTMSEEARQALIRQIDQKTRALNRDTEDAQADFEQDQNRILQELGQRMMVVIGKYARDNGYALILDVSSPQTPVLYAANGIDITSDIVALYDKNTPTDAAPPKPAAAAPPKPATPPATKK